MTEPRSYTRDEMKRILQSAPRVTPSNPNTFPGMWEGQRAEGSRWTAAQLVTLRREPEAVEAWWIELSDGSRVDCPLLARSKDGRRIFIIAPGGDKVWRDAVHD